LWGEEQRTMGVTNLKAIMGDGMRGDGTSLINEHIGITNTKSRRGKAGDTPERSQKKREGQHP